MNKKALTALIVGVIMLVGTIGVIPTVVNAQSTDFSNSYILWVQNDLTHVFKNSTPTTQNVAYLYGAGNEYVDFQLVVTPSTYLVNVYAKATNLVSTNGNIINNSNIQIYRERYINITNTSVNGPYNYLVIPPETSWPDPLPILYPFNATPDRNYPIWVDIFIPQGTPQGNYNGLITVTTSNAGKENISVSLTVYGFSIPYANTYPVVAGMGVWSLPLKYWGLNTSSTWDYYEVANATYWFLINHRIVPYNPPFGISYSGWPIKNISESYFFNNPRVTNFIFPITYNRTIDNRNLQYAISNGWLSKAYTYTNDEPALSDYIGLYPYNENITNEASYVHSLDPHLNFMQTGYSLPTSGPLFNNITTFDFHIERFASNSSWVSYYHDHGKNVWWYTCITPQYPLPEFDLDSYVASEVAISLAQYLYGVNGMLYFSVGADFEWGQNPWVHPWEGFNYDPANLDGTLIYPGGPLYNPAGNPYAPVGSIRLNDLRDGIQDYEMLTVLNNTLTNVENQYGWSNINNNQIIDNLIHIAVNSLTNYSLNYNNYETMIRDVAQLIEELNSPLPLIVLSEYGNYNTTVFNTINKEWLSGYTVPGAYVTVNGLPISTTSNGYFNISVPLHSGFNTILVTSNYAGEITTNNIAINVAVPSTQFIPIKIFSITPTNSGSILNMSLNQSNFKDHLIYSGYATNDNGTVPLANISAYMTYNDSDAFMFVNYTSLNTKFTPPSFIWIYLAPYLNFPEYDRSFGILWPSNISNPNEFGIVTDKNGMDEWGYGWISHPLYSAQKNINNNTVIAEFTIPYTSLNVTLPFKAVNSKPPTPAYASPEISDYWGINIEVPSGGNLYPTYGDWFYEGGNSHRLDYVVFDPNSSSGLPNLQSTISSNLSTLNSSCNTSLISIHVLSNNSPISFAEIHLSASLGGIFSNVFYGGNGTYYVRYTAPTLNSTKLDEIIADISAVGYQNTSISTTISVQYFPSESIESILSQINSELLNITNSINNLSLNIKNNLTATSSELAELKNSLNNIETEANYLNSTYHTNITNIQNKITSLQSGIDNLQNITNTQQIHTNNVENGLNFSYILGTIALIIGVIGIIISMVIYTKNRKTQKTEEKINKKE